MNICLRLFLSLSFMLVAYGGYAQQQQDDDAQTSIFNIEGNSTFNSYYYQDPFSSNLDFEPIISDDALDPDTYILGTNDVITIDIDASQKLLFRALFINSQGDVVMPILGSINLSGKSISEAQQIVNDKALEVFKNPSVKITLEQPKPLVFYIQGNVSSPGRHVAAPFSRVDRAIYNAVTGNTNTPPENPIELLNANDLSLRNITIKHQDGTITKADVVAYFKAGKIEMNPVIRNGDQIKIEQISRTSPTVSISGAVQNAIELEYSEGDTPQLLLDIAGEFTPDADTSKLLVFRNTPNNTERIEVPKSEWNSFEVQPNDRLIVSQNNDKPNNTSAWVYGEVDTPGNFPVVVGRTTALDLLNISGGLTERALPAAAYLVRAGSIENEIPNKFNTNSMKRTSNQIAQGFEYLELETGISRNRVFIDLTDEEQLSEVKIYNGDRMYVPRNEETVFVFGQVNNPGYYPFNSKETSAHDYVNRAGGFALSADAERIFVIKAGNNTWYRPEQTTIKSGDRIFVDRIPFDELNAMRNYEVQKEQIKNTRIQLILTGITTITGIITTYVAITR